LPIGDWRLQIADLKARPLHSLPAVVGIRCSKFLKIAAETFPLDAYVQCADVSDYTVMKLLFVQESIPQSVRAGSPLTAPRKHVLAASLIATIVATLLSFSAETSQAGSATWLANPATNHWNNANNWTAGGPPNGPNDIATFATSNTTDIIHTADVEVSGIVFNSGASAFTITTGATATLTLINAGITDNAAAAENFETTGSSTANMVGGQIFFLNSATAGTAAFTNNAATITNAGGGSTHFFGSARAGHGTFTNKLSSVSAAESGFTAFHNSSSAQNGTFMNEAGGSTFPYGGTLFYDTSTAANATITNEGLDSPLTLFSNSSTAATSTINNNAAVASYGRTVFDDNSTAANSVINNHGGTAAYMAGGELVFDDVGDPNSTASAGNATINNYGGTANGAFGGRTDFAGGTAGNATIMAYSGSNSGAGGEIDFGAYGDGGTARLEVFGNGYLWLFDLVVPSVTIGSLEGNGSVYLSGNNLSIGSNNLSTTFSGVISNQDPFGNYGPLIGSMTKVGTGTLTLSSASSYSGGTTVTTGMLVAGHNRALGAGDVTVASGATLTMQNGTTNDYIFDGASLSIASSSTVNLNFTGAPDIVGFLIIDGVSQPAGLYGGPASPAPHMLPEFTGTGEVLVVTPSASSRKLHGGVPFDVALPFTGVDGIECRSGGTSNAFQILATFGETVTFSSAQVTSGTGTVASTSGNGTSTVTINLTGVTDAQRLAVTLFNVNYGPATGNLPIRMAVLLGDTNGNGTTNAADVAQTKRRLGQSITTTNFRSDVNVSGTITASDVAIVKANLGHGLP
jgi:autotransporter-associated beta strand protein